MNAKATQVLEVNFIQGADSTGEAKRAAEEAKLSATHAYNSEVKAKASEEAATQSEANAKVSEDNAKASELAAKASEENAAASETAADTYQEQAGAYAETAFGASAPAWDSTATYNYPQVVAYTDGKTYRCVGTNVTGSDVPGSSNKWVAITLDTDDFWDIDIDGGYMPSLSPMYSASWEIDGNGDLEPKLAN
jgi:ribosomal protein L14E/L6E/L27E